MRACARERICCQNHRERDGDGDRERERKKEEGREREKLGVRREENDSKRTKEGRGGRGEAGSRGGRNWVVRGEGQEGTRRRDLLFIQVGSSGEGGCWRVREMASHLTPAPIILETRARERSRPHMQTTGLATVPAARDVGKKDRAHQRVLEPGGLKPPLGPLPLSLGKSLNNVQSLCPTVSAPRSPLPSSCRAAQGHSPLGTPALLVTLGQGPD